MQKATDHTFSYPAGRVSFSPTRPRCYAIETQLTGGEGADATNAVRESIRRMFEETDALIIEAQVPLDNARSRLVANIVGLAEISQSHGQSHRRLTIAQWLRSNASPKAEAKRPLR